MRTREMKIRLLPLWRRNLAKGREPKARKKALVSLRANGAREEFRSKMSRIVKARLEDPKELKRHRIRTREYIKTHGANYRGGNGQRMTPLIRSAVKELEPMGFIREYVVITRGHTTLHNPPGGYKVDFGNPNLQIAIEFDGRSHHRLKQRALDCKKDQVLESLGWIVIRIYHGN